MLNSDNSEITCLLSSDQFVRCQQELLIYNKILIATFLAPIQGIKQVLFRACQELQMALNPSLLRFILKMTVENTTRDVFVSENAAVRVRALKLLPLYIFTLSTKDCTSPSHNRNDAKR